MKTETLTRLAAGAVCAAAAAAAVYLAARYAAPILLPFLAAFLLSVPVRKGAAWLTKKTGFHPAAGRLLVLLLFIALVTVLLVRCGGRLIREAGELVEAGINYLAEPDNLLRRAADKLDELEARILPHSDGIGGAVYDAAAEMLSSALGRLTSAAALWAGDLIGALPGVLLTSFTGLVALFYFSLDYDRIRAGVLRLLPDAWRARCGAFREKFRLAAGGYARAYGLIFLITYAEVLAGLTLLRCRYAILVSLAVAVVDILPVLGVGTVLVPWSIVCFLTDDVRRGIGLLVLFGVTSVVREFVEPKLLGRCIGLHPLAALLAIYAGFRLGGITGMILFPIAAYFTRAFVGDFAKSPTPRKP